MIEFDNSSLVFLGIIAVVFIGPFIYSFMIDAFYKEEQKKRD